MRVQVVLTLLLLTISTSLVIQTEFATQTGDIGGLLKLIELVRNNDGSNNNLNHPEWGKSYTNIIRKTPARYEDGKSVPITNLPNPRFLSQTVSKLDGNIVIPNQFNLTMMFGTWGQFLDHDITLSDEGTTQQVTIRVPRCDKFFDKNCTGKQNITYYRSQYDPTQTVRTNINQLSTWIDASMVYGSVKSISDKLRSFTRGKLRASAGEMLPIGDDGDYFAGDVRATENMGLTTLQIIFLREHNRLCDIIYEANKTLTDQQIYLGARNYVAGLIQKISFYDYLPNLMGRAYFNKYLGAYKGYNISANPTITTEFSSTAYRIGHPYVPHTYKAVDVNNNTVQQINLMQLFLCSPQTLTYFRANNILKGLAFTLAKQRTLAYVDELRNIPSEILGKNFDLFAINTERNRDHGVADYNTLREAFGLKKATSWEQIFDDETDRYVIEKCYNSLDNIDTYVGVLGEVKLPGSMFGQLGLTIAAEQFKNIRDGDRLWFQNLYPSSIIDQIKKTTITDIILRNSIIRNMPTDPFFCHNCSV